MPFFNARPTILHAVRSILRQTLENIELIAVDDGSDDGSRELVETLSESDPRIRIIGVERGGIVKALNAGIAQARGSLIARMDADDISHPKRLELQAAFMLEHPDIALTGTGIRKFPRRHIMGGMAHYEQWINSVVSETEIRRDLFVESPFPHPTVMFRREAARSLGGYRDLGWPEDYDLWLRFAEAGFGMAKLPQQLVAWREGEKRLSRRDGMYSAEAFRRVKAHFLRTWRLKSARELQIWGAGRDGKTWAKLLRAEGFNIVQFIDIDSKKIGGRACGDIPVVWPADIIKGMPIVCAVGVKGARAQIRDYLLLDGYAEPEEFLFVS
jgi:glycosyltransferase involved in cell wall biosynthesis